MLYSKALKRIFNLALHWDILSVNNSEKEYTKLWKGKSKEVDGEIKIERFNKIQRQPNEEGFFIWMWWHPAD